MRQHLFEKKPSTRTRRLDGMVDVHPGDVKKIKRLLGRALSRIERTRRRRRHRDGTGQARRQREEAPQQILRRPRATTATRAVRSGPPTSRSCTPGSTRSATAGPRRASSVACGSSGSTPPAALNDMSLQPVHRRTERCRHRGRPQGPRRPRRHRSGRIRRAGRRRPRAPRLSRSSGAALVMSGELLGFTQSTGPTTAAPARAPQCAFRGRRVRHRRPGLHRRGGGSAGWDVEAQFVAPGGASDRRRRSTCAIWRRACSSGWHRPRRRSRCSPIVADRRADGPSPRRRRDSSIVADRIGDPGNLGTILRSAEAAGADARRAHCRVGRSVSTRRWCGRRPEHCSTCPSCIGIARRRSRGGLAPDRHLVAPGRAVHRPRPRRAARHRRRQRGTRPRRRCAGRRLGHDPPPRPGREPQRRHGDHGALLRPRPGARINRRSRTGNSPLASGGVMRAGDSRRFRCPRVVAWGAGVH